MAIIWTFNMYLPLVYQIMSVMSLRLREFLNYRLNSEAFCIEAPFNPYNNAQRLAQKITTDAQRCGHRKVMTRIAKHNRDKEESGARQDKSLESLASFPAVTK